jgi:importin subunit alpha-1
VEKVLNAGSLPFFVEMLKHQEATLVFEAAWALTNIASTNMMDSVFRLGAVPLLAKLLIHDSPDVREQAAWCLGNIAGDKNEYRDALLDNDDVVSGMVKNLEEPTTPSLLQNLSWLVSNLCRGKPEPALAKVKPLIAPLCKVIKMALEANPADGDTKRHELLVDPVWCVTYLSDGDNTRIQVVMDAGDILGHLIDILKDPSTDRAVLLPATCCLGNFVSGNHEQTSAVIDAGVLKHIPELLEHPSVRLTSFYALR